MKGWNEIFHPLTREAPRSGILDSLWSPRLSWVQDPESPPNQVLFQGIQEGCSLKQVRVVRKAQTWTSEPGKDGAAMRICSPPVSHRSPWRPPSATRTQPCGSMCNPRAAYWSGFETSWPIAWPWMGPPGQKSSSGSTVARACITGPVALFGDPLVLRTEGTIGALGPSAQPLLANAYWSNPSPFFVFCLGKLRLKNERIFFLSSPVSVSDLKSFLPCAWQV